MCKDPYSAGNIPNTSPKTDESKSRRKEEGERLKYEYDEHLLRSQPRASREDDRR